MKKILSLVLVMALLVSCLAGCGSEPAQTATPGAEATPKAEKTWSGSITNSGSSALKPLADVAAEKFMDANPDAMLSISAGGSGTGLKQVADGSVDIGSSDVFAETKLTAEQCANLIDYKVCTIAFAAVVNNDLGVTNLTTEQLIGIFTGKITNWSEVGGPSEKITLITRPESSGTRATFTAEALQGNQEVKGSIETDNSGELLETVKSTKGAIGYLAFSYTVNDYAGMVTKVAIDGVEATQENVYNGTYNVWGYEHMYTAKDADPLATAFIEYMMSNEFASEIEKMGYGASSKHTTSK